MMVTALTLALLLAGPSAGADPALEVIDGAQKLVEAGRLAEAQEALLEAISQHPEHAGLRLALGRLQLRQGDVEGASGSLEEALARAADPGVVLPMLGQAYLLQERPGEARTALERAIQHNPSDLGSLYNLGRLLRLEREAEAAVAVLEKALALEPGPRMRHRIQANLGPLYLETRRYARALQLYQEFSRREPKEAQWHYSLALAHEGLGRPREALEQGREAIRLDPALAAAHALTGTQLRTLGELEEAFDLAEKAIELAPQDTYSLALAASLELDLGRHARAISRARRLLEIEPGHSRGHYLLGQALLAAGNREEAEAEFAIHRRLAAERRAFHHTAASLGDE